MEQDRSWKYSADGTASGWVKNKATLLWVKAANLFRLFALLVVVVSAYNLFAVFLTFAPVLAFWPSFLNTYAPAGMSVITQQFLAGVVGAIIVWFS